MMQLNAARGRMNRRRFLGMLGLGTTGLSLMGGTILAPTAEATPALVAIAVVQTAVSIVKLFSIGGNDRASQIGSMLEAISKELVTIEAGIQEILQRLDEIKELIGEIPEAVVQETQRAEITGLLTVYTLTMETYARDSKDKGIAFSRAKNIPPLENQVIIPLKKSVAILTGYHASGMVPIICATSYVHVKAMILANYTKNDLIPVLGMYQKWLKVMVGRLTNEITERNESLNGLQDKMEGLTHPFSCTGRVPSNLYKGITETYSPSLVVREFDPQVSIAASEMIAKKLMPASQVPNYNEFSLNQRTSLVAIDTLDPMPPDAINACAKKIDGLRQAFKAAAAPLPEMALQLMSRRALKFAAETTLNALIKQQRQIERLG